MRGVLLLLLIARSGALRPSFPRTRKRKFRPQERPTLIDRRFRASSSTYPSICTIRGGETTALSLSPLSNAVQSGFVDSVLPSGILGSINSFFKCYPLIASFLICALKASSADGFAQFVSFKKSFVSSRTSENSNFRTITSSSTMSSRPKFFSFKRNFALLCYGGLYQGCGQELIYNNLFSALFGAGTQARTVMMKVCFDMLMVQPFLSLPIAYVIKAPIFGYSLADSMRRYLIDVKQKYLIQKCWLVWTPTQIVSFTVIPKHLRITFMASVSFFWLILFSTVASDQDHNPNP